jgi:membrane-associated protein
MINFLNQLFDVTTLIQSFGLIGILSIVFAESGLFFGFFLPGDSLLFTAGFLASQNFLPILPLLFGSFVAAVIGDSVGYAFGHKVGRPLFKREDSFFFKKKYLEKTQSFFEKYGSKAIILARFVPIVRTFTPILAGVGQMKYSHFLTYNIIGGAGWSFGLVLSGYFMGRLIPNVDRYLLPIILAIIAISFLPAVYEFWKNHQKGL